MVDEEYCLISTLTFVLSGFKMAICYVKDEIDMPSLQAKVEEAENLFEKLYKKLAKFLDQSQKSSTALFESKTCWI
jgi:hypothetical protein